MMIPMNILITGATGLIGSQLGIQLVKKGHTLFALSRNVKKAKLTAPFPAKWIECDLQKEKIPSEHLKAIDGVIHLAGENVGESAWTEDQKKNILQSRTLGTQNLINSLNTQSLKFFISASAIGYYGSSETASTETDPVGIGFLAEVTEAWEKEVLKIKDSTRVCVFRIGVVLATEGGALPKMVFPAQIFASSPLGSGQQWLSWIHIDDVVRAFSTAAESQNFKGIYNLVAPNPCRQKEMAQVIAHNLKSFNGPPVPSFVLKLMLGEQASLAMTTLNVSSQKLQDSGFKFSFANVSSALNDILSSWANGASVKTFRQYFDLPIEKIFSFFSDAKNLETITPEFLNFKILKVSTDKIEEGTLLDYSLKVRGMPLKWRTQIDTWNPPHSFKDTQLKGPYSLWHHTHQFEKLGHGTLMTDIIHYKLPMGLLGRLMAQALVNKDVENIFSYRRISVAEKL